MATRSSESSLLLQNIFRTDDAGGFAPLDLARLCYRRRGEDPDDSSGDDDDEPRLEFR